MKQYEYVSDLIKGIFKNNNNVELKNVVDMGCFKCHMLKYLPKFNFETIQFVDINKNFIQSSKRAANRIMRNENINIELLVGDVTIKDYRLKNADIVICIDLIEFFSLRELDEFVENIFNFIRPKFVIIVAANFDFNQFLFKRSPENSDYYFLLREKKHIFEFNQEEFRAWSNDIIKNYPNYQYKIYGFGPVSEDIDHDTYGHYNQTVVFEKVKNIDETKDKEVSSNKNHLFIDNTISPINFQCNVVLF